MSVLISYSKVLEISGDIIRVEVPPGGHYSDSAAVAAP
jgi:V/A-type H+/Na+-transporting ATPase subunit B